MKVLVINGSPKADNSESMKLTSAFLEGMEVQDYEVIHTIKEQVKPCLGCYACWWGNTPGECVQKDGMKEVLEKIKNSDLVIWTFPLYCYGFPSNLKAYIDRLLPLSTPVQATDENGNTYHPARSEHDVRFVMISGCGFPNKEGNYDAAIFSFNKMFPYSEIITCVEAPMLAVEEAKPLALQYLDKVKMAGKEYAQNGCISEDTHKLLDIPMMDPDEYRKMCSNL